jgi:hypothetical protein
MQILSFLLLVAKVLREEWLPARAKSKTPRCRGAHNAVKLENGRKHRTVVYAGNAGIPSGG